MTDLELARENLGGHTLVLCRGGELMISDARGVSPMMDYIAEGRDLHGFSAADVIVGKATAMLFVKAGITAVYAGVVSAAGKKYLEEHGVPLTFGSVTERIMNRAGAFICLACQPSNMMLTSAAASPQYWSLLGRSPKKINANSAESSKTPPLSTVLTTVVFIFESR